jgi:hypothetical protein
VTFAPSFPKCKTAWSFAVAIQSRPVQFLVPVGIDSGFNFLKATSIICSRIIFGRFDFLWHFHQIAIAQGGAPSLIAAAKGHTCGTFLLRTFAA